MTQRRFLTGLYGATFLGCLAICVATLRSQGLHADDAWMFIRYADNLLQHGVMSWNPGGEPTFGITSLSHLALITILRGLGFGHTLCLQLATLLPALVLVGLLLNQARRRLGERLDLHVIACALVLYAVASANFRVHLTSGMDTILGVLAAYLLVWSALELQRGLSRGNALRFHAATLLALATRPEMALFAAWYSLGIWMAQERSSRRAGGAPVGHRIVSWVLAPQIAMAVAGVAALWLYFGDPIPYTYYAKRPGHYQDLHDGYLSMPRDELRQLALSYAPLLVSLAAFSPRLQTLLFVLPAQFLLIAHAFGIVWVMGYQSRFYMPVVGALLFLVVDGLARCAEERRDRWRQPASAALAGAALGALLAAWGSQPAAWVWLAVAALAAVGRWRRPRSLALPVACLSLVLAQAAWLQQRKPLKRSLANTQPFFLVLSDNLRPLADDLTIAATEHGLLGAENPDKTILDLAGLHDPVFARRFDTDRLFDHEPDLILMPRWVYRGMIRAIEDDERFRRRYLYLSRDDPGVAEACRREGIGVAIRRGGRHSQGLEQAVRNAALQALGRGTGRL